MSRCDHNHSAVKPLFLPDNLHPEKPKSWWDAFVYDFPGLGGMAEARGSLYEQLVYRNKCNINISDYWFDEKSLDIVRKIIAIIKKHTRMKVLLLPDDPMCLFCMLLGDDFQVVGILIGIDDQCGCSLPEDALVAPNTFGDFVENIKRFSD